MINEKMKRVGSLIRAYMIISKYLPRSIVMNQNGIPFLLKMFSLITVQRPFPHFSENGSFIKISTDCRFMIRKRKVLVIDEKNEAIFHVFLSPHDASEYKINRDRFALQVAQGCLFPPNYSCKTDAYNLLVVAEEKVPGVSLDTCDHDTVECFLDIWLDSARSNWWLHRDTEAERSVYAELSSAVYRLKQELSPDSPFFTLYSACECPFDENDGFWPVSFCHGQALPVNILCDQEHDQYCFIDYEPELMGVAPYAYDFSFFILYSEHLVSPGYKVKLKSMLSHGFLGCEWDKHILAQIVWWSRNRKMNQGRAEKIFERSLIALSLIDEKG